jgi:hypothetical protein
MVPSAKTKEASAITATSPLGRGVPVNRPFNWVDVNRRVGFFTSLLHSILLFGWVIAAATCSAALAMFAVGTAVSSRPRTDPDGRNSRIRLLPRVIDGKACFRPRVKDFGFGSQSLVRWERRPNRLRVLRRQARVGGSGLSARHYRTCEQTHEACLHTFDCGDNVWVSMRSSINARKRPSTFAVMRGLTFNNRSPAPVVQFKPLNLLAFLCWREIGSHFSMFLITPTTTSPIYVDGA